MARARTSWALMGVAAGVIYMAQGTPARKSKEISDDYDYAYDSDEGPLTCPGFPGYCSESYVGDTCTVVCARGRNNVPQCQEDGTWTDIPRCIEHDPGVEEQVTGICPGIPGYCSLDWPGALCEFECSIGPAIRSSCTTDGTWDPYPTCQGDPRETQDGCNPCPGPDGDKRNRTLEAGGGNGGRAQTTNRGNNQISLNAGRKQGGGNRSGGNQNRNEVANNQKSGGNINGGQNRGNQGGGNKQSGRQNTAPSANQNRSQNGGQNRSQNGGQNQNQNGGQKRNGGQNRNQNGGQNRNDGREESRSQSGASQTGGQPADQCPGEELQRCIDVCPGFSARVFGACVTGCAKRCPGKK